MSPYNPFAENNADDFDDGDNDNGGFSGTIGDMGGFAWEDDREQVEASSSNRAQGQGAPTTKHGDKKTDIKTSDVIVVNKKRSNVIFRNIILIACAFLMVFGVFRIVHPQKTLTDSEITSIASSGLGVSSFPAQEAEVYVQKFAETYFSSDVNRSSSLSKYGISDPSFSPVDGTTIVSGPFVGDVEYLSDSTASFTISANMSSTGWVYFSVPVYYDKSSDSFSILGDPTAVPAPATLSGNAEVDEDALGSIQDDTTTSSITPVVETFFKAYGASDQNALKTVTLDNVSNARVFAGFGGKYTFVQLSSVEVRRKSSMPESNYWVVASVSWSYVPTVSSDDESGLEPTTATSASTFDSKYQLKVQQSNGKFYIVDVQPLQYTVSSTSSDTSGTTGTSGATGTTN